MNFFKLKSTLVRRLVFWPILIVFTTVLVMGFFFSYYLSQQSIKTSISNAKASLNTVVESFDNHIQETERLATIFANSFEAQGGDIDSLLLNLKKVLSNESTTNFYADAFVSDYAGFCKDVNGRTFFLDSKQKSLIQSGELSVNVIKSPSWENAGLPLLRIGAPIKIYGNFQGGVFFDLFLTNKDSEFYNLVVNGPKISGSGYGFALTNTGTTIIHKDADFIWVNILNSKVVEFSSRPSVPLPDFLRYKMYEKSKIAIGTTDKITGLKLYVTAYLKTISQTIRRSVMLIFIVFTMLAVFIGFFLYFQTNPISKDILVINDALKEIEKGHYDFELKTVSKTEIDEMAKNLLNTSVSIKSYIGKIQSLTSYMENILNNLNEVIITTDSQGRIEFYNARLKDLVNLKMSDIKGKPLNDLIESNNINIYFDVEKTLAHEKPLYFPDVEFGSKIFDVYIIPYHVKELTGILFTAYDVSKRVDLETHLSHIQRIQSMGTMVSGIAHDFNNFLSGILGYINLIEISQNEDEKEEYITKLYHYINEAKKLVNKLLIFAKSDFSSKEIIPIEDLVHEAIDIVKNNTKLKSITFELDFPDPDIKVEMDKTEFLQIFTNLATNSIDAIESVGTITIRAQAVYLKDKYYDLNSGAYAKIIFNDNGRGMEQKYLDKIFDPFFTTKNEGTGLGLYVVATIVRKYGGSIKVLSKKDIGTTFEIYLPLYHGKLQNTSKDVERYVYGNGQKILIVDDDSTVRNVTKKMLEKLHYIVYGANGVDEALKLLKMHKSEIDLIILDVVMPKRDARDLMYELKVNNFDIPVILISGFVSKLEEFYEYPFYKDFMPKPFDIKRLSLMVAKYVGRYYD